MAKQIGFIGLGIMGKPMALNLLKAGHTVTVFDIHTEAVLALKEVGANAAASAAEAKIRKRYHHHDASKR